MKKLISIILSIVMLVGGTGAIVWGILSKGKPVPTESELERFTEDVAELISSSASSETPMGEDNSQSKAFISAEMSFSAEKRVIVKSPEKIDTLNAVKVAEGYNDLHVLQFASSEDADRALEYYEKQPNTVYAQKDAVFKTCEVDMSETEISTVDVSNLTAKESEAIGVTQLKKYLSDNNVTYQREIVVAVVDTGIESTHEIFEGRLAPNDFNSVGGENAEDDYGHGTHVAGIVVANSLENVKVKPYKVLNEKGEGTDLQVYLGVQAAIDDGVDVINCSFGRQGDSDMMTEAVQRAYAANIPVVVAAGNEFIYLSTERGNYTPATIPECITVMSCNLNMTAIPGFTNFGPACDIAAPGVKIKSAYLNNTYIEASGTSMSTPFVSAAVTYILLDNENITSEQVEKRITEYGYPIGYESSASFGNFVCNNTPAVYAEFLTREIPKASDVIFSVEEDTFTETFQLELSSDIDGANIYYHTPAMFENTYFRYSTPFTIKSDWEISAYVFKKGMKIGDVSTKTYTRITPDENSKYDIDQDGVITAYYGEDEDVIVPEKVDGITVTQIGTSAFRGKKMKTVILPDTVEILQSVSFWECENLEFVHMDSVYRTYAAFQDCKNLRFVESKNLTEIGDHAFYGCTNLQYADLYNATDIGASAFSGVQGIYSLVNNKITKVSTGAFEDTSLVLVDLPRVEMIAISSFKNCVNLKDVNIPSATSIGSGAFSGDVSLTEAAYENVTTLVRGAYEGCTSLQSVSFPNVIGLGDGHSPGDINTFKDCTSLTDVYLPNIQTIGDGVFQNCISLKEAVYPNVTKMGRRVFAGCTSLEKVYFPNLQEMNVNAFYDCPNLYEVYLPSLTELRCIAFIDHQDDVMNVSKVVFDKAEVLHILPNNCNLALPSTVTDIMTSDIAPKNQLPENTTIYATQGTFAYNWAVEKNIPVKEITQETALLSDLPPHCDIGNDILYADVIGFNRTYQWYGNTEEDNTTGTAIEGATEQTFNPADYPYYPYYYCVVTSTDTGFDPVTIRTGLSKDKSLCADYSRVFEAIKNIPEDLTVYSDETLAVLQNALDSIDYYLPPEQQETVDGYADAINEAVAAFEYRSADYTAYNKLIAYAQRMDRSIMLNDFTEIDRLLAIDISGLDIWHQAEVDALAEELEFQLYHNVIYMDADYTEYDIIADKAWELIMSDKYTYEEIKALDDLFSVNLWSIQEDGYTFLVDARWQYLIDDTTHRMYCEYYKLEGFCLNDNANAVLDKDTDAGITYVGIDPSCKNVSELNSSFADSSVKYAVYRNGNLLEDDSYLCTGDVIKCMDPKTDEVWAEARVVLYGDVNGDGAVDAFDAIAIDLMNHDMHSPLNEYAKASDINGDGSTDNADYSIVVAYVRCESDISIKI